MEIQIDPHYSLMVLLLPLALPMAVLLLPLALPMVVLLLLVAECRTFASSSCSACYSVQPFAARDAALAEPDVFFPVPPLIIVDPIHPEDILFPPCVHSENVLFPPCVHSDAPPSSS